MTEPGSVLCGRLRNDNHVRWLSCSANGYINETNRGPCWDHTPQRLSCCQKRGWGRGGLPYVASKRLYLCVGSQQAPSAAPFHTLLTSFSGAS